MKAYFFIIGIIAAFLIAGCSASTVEFPAEELHSEPSISVDAQAVDGNILVREAFLDKPGYIVIHKVVDGAPGPIVGSSGILEGDIHDFSISVSESESETELIAMLHYDDGDSAYEFPGDDAPVVHEEKVVTTKFAVESSGVVGTSMPVPGSEGVEETAVVPESGADAASIKSFEIIAKQWEFVPDTITVKEGDTVRLNVRSIDVDHGIGIPQFGINEYLSSGKNVEIEFVADKAGTYTFFCSVQCGSGHRDMQGQLIVEP